MISNKANPFGFFQKFLEETIYKEWTLMKNSGPYLLQSAEDYIDEKEKALFIMDSIQEGDSPNMKILSLESQVKSTILNELDNTISILELEYHNRKYQERKLKGYKDLIMNKYTTLREMRAFHDFPFLGTLFTKVDNFVRANFTVNDNIVNNLPSLEDNSEQDFDGINSLFRVKEPFNKRFFVSLFDIAIKYDIVDDIYQEEFLDVFMYQEKGSKIKFLSQNSIAFNFLEALTPIFYKWNGRIIEESQLFFTKGNKVIKGSNYHRSKKIRGEKDGVFIQKMKAEIQDLINLNTA